MIRPGTVICGSLMLALASCSLRNDHCIQYIDDPTENVSNLTELATELGLSPSPRELFFVTGWALAVSQRQEGLVLICLRAGAAGEMEFRILSEEETGYDDWASVLERSRSAEEDHSADERD